MVDALEKSFDDDECLGDTNAAKTILQLADTADCRFFECDLATMVERARNRKQATLGGVFPAIGGALQAGATRRDGLLCIHVRAPVAQDKLLNFARSSFRKFLNELELVRNLEVG